MDVMTKMNDKKTRFLNGLGTAGYVGVFAQWMWLAIVFLPWIVNVTNTDQATCPPVLQQHDITTYQPSLISSVIGISLGLVVVGVFLYILIRKIPKDIAKVGEAITHQTTKVVAPVATKHLSSKIAKKREIPGMVMIVVKYVMAFLPLLLILFAQTNPLTLVTFEVAMTVGVVLFAWSFFVFITQYVASRILKISYKDLR